MRGGGEKLAKIQWYVDISRKLICSKVQIYICLQISRNFSRMFEVLATKASRKCSDFWGLLRVTIHFLSTKQFYVRIMRVFL